VLCLRGLFGRGALAQLASRSLPGPGARIDLAYHAQPFLGLGEGGEVTHVQPEALAALLEAAAHEEIEALELGQLRLRERHGRRGGTQVEHEWPRTAGWCARIHCVGTARARSEIGRCCHNFPEPNTSYATVLLRGVVNGGIASLASGAIVAAPPS
jgi:hypothetical protein